ncbi:peptide chain release factor N(5)-glutamine methyltransferase [archaeon]|nr:MAG: peptide chain release factor N(5)-glutamine methyltransferase [archaeon]
MNVLVIGIIMMTIVKSNMILGLRLLSKLHHPVFHHIAKHSIFRYMATSSSIFGTDISTSNLTIESAHRLAAKWLEQQNVPEPSESSRHLIMHAANLGTRYSDFQKNIHKVLSPSQPFFEHLVQQRAQRVPVQYIIGSWDFYGLHIICQPPILIPRPETEELVEKALEDLNSIKRTKQEVLDVGAGTGVIGIALCAQMPETHVTAIDINPQAVKLARQNALHNLQNSQRYSVIESDFLSFSQQTHLNGRKLFDMIISNPPYIPSNQLAGLQAEVVQFEDKAALDGGERGLDIIMQLVEWGGRLLSPEGTKVMWLEVDTSHPALITELFYDNKLNKDKYGIEAVCSYKDLSGNPRFVRIKYV